MRVVTPLVADEPKRRTATVRRHASGPARSCRSHRGLRAPPQGPGTEVARGHPPGACPRCRPGTTLRVEILAERRGSELRADVTAEAENVHVHAWLDGVQAMEREFKAPRRSEVDLLGEALEVGGRDPVDRRERPDGGRDRRRHEGRSTAG